MFLVVFGCFVAVVLLVSKKQATQNQICRERGTESSLQHVRLVWAAKNTQKGCTSTPSTVNAKKKAAQNNNINFKDNSKL